MQSPSIEEHWKQDLKEQDHGHVVQHLPRSSVENVCNEPIK